ncbi:MAG TPA: iron donor protein CyaY [Alphaproteobacteria bacterium]|nr:iron donor protein CyaY [Alphaproteobacteria bacterium]
MDQSAFETLVDGTLAELMERLEAQLADEDIELNAGILTIELADGRQYVINKHGPNRQLWMSSPVSGAWHFAWDSEARAWRSTRGTETLHRLLEAELTAIVGTGVALG